MRPTRIPLFPLEVVLFPGIPLPLHIFEPRYKEMTQECLEKRLEFGVVLGRENGIAAVGCTAAIQQMVKKYDDGRMDLLTVGQVPFQVAEVFDDKAYLEASVEYLADETDGGAATDQSKLLGLYRECYAVVHGRNPHSEGSPPGVSLSYVMAAELPLDLEFKQELLEMRSESERQQCLVEKMEKWLPELRMLERAKRKAGGNGHARA